MAYIIKVEYEGTLRRLLVSRAEKEDLSFTKLEAKVRDLFKLPNTSQLQMTYKDKENDVVTMANDQDLTDACITQKINPLYVHVALSHKVPEVAQHNSPPVTERPPGQQSNQRPHGKPVTSEKSAKKTVKIVDPVFQAALHPNQVPQMMENIFKMVTSQRHPEKEKESNATCTPGPKEAAKVNDPTKVSSETPSKKVEEKKSEAKSEGSDQAIHVGVSCDICQINPIVGPRFKAVKRVNYDLCGRCFGKVGNANDYKRCEQPIKHPAGPGTTSVKLVRMSPAVATGRIGMGLSPVMVVGRRRGVDNQVKSC